MTVGPENDGLAHLTYKRFYPVRSAMSNVTLDLETWYLMVYGGVLLAIVTSGLLFRGQSLSTYPVIRHFLQFWRRGICILARTYRKHLAYPFLVPRTGRAKGITRLEGVVALLILLSNILALSVPSIAPTDLSTRAGLLAMTNLVFVLVSPLSLAASILHVSYRVQRRLHLSCGWVVLIVLLIHVVPAMMHGQVDLKDSRLSIGVYVSFPSVTRPSNLTMVGCSCNSRTSAGKLTVSASIII